MEEQTRNCNSRWNFISFLISLVRRKQLKRTVAPLPSGFGFLNYKFKCKIYYDENADSDFLQGSSWSWSYNNWIYNYLCNQCISPLMLWFRRISIRARCTIVCGKVCKWLATGQWFSPGPPVSSTNKTDRDDITEILLKEWR
jgi:hypothetical protein